ncbi:hypothetical protein P171DRAFT_433391 [Karstenula rhodostoma CBS 690.94]|uniref:Ribosomal protein S21 n=1 Tax=Karstenula rhodostoma CBS 690.94 TaxID=1392251 RepID=A0A9P4PHF3_9PLEO|nr:hypothetical protein P171DRAFT_433391 [Karstenula rhodostoma CBS 690.94]
MSSRSLGELLLRPTSLSRLSCAQTLTRAAPPSWSAHRTISTSHTTQAAQPQPKEDTAHDTPPQPDTPASAERTSKAIDNLFGAMPGRAFARQSPSAYTRTSQEETAERARNVFGSDFSNARQGSAFQRRPAGLDFGSMSMDGLPLNLPNQTAAVPLEPEKQAYPRLNPAFGRTVDLKPEVGRDLVRGIGMLSSLVSRNKIRSDMMKQRFHERPGLKRKRLKSERWRSLFKKGFQEVTGRVSELTRKGW